METAAGQSLGPYTLLAPLAHGGMGDVFFAARRDQPQPRTLLLVKTLKSNLVGVDDYAGRFNDEARVAVRLRHPNLLEVTDAGIDGETFYLAMELIEGITFRRLQFLLDAKKLRLRSTEAAALAVALLRGLHAAHTATDESGRPLGVVHRDVSPHNAMLDIGGRVKVIDYGLATSVLKETFTESMVALGKSAYMPPEQARGEDVTPAGDQYAAAIVFYELLTSERFYGDLNSRAIWGIAGSGQHKPRSWSRVPERFRPHLMKALSSKPADRFASCADFVDAIVSVDPRAANSEALGGLQNLLLELAPAELDLIADARAKLSRVEDVSEPTERAPGPSSPAEPTQLVRRDAPADDTASTLLRPRASALSKPTRRRRAPLLVAAAAGAAVLAVVVPLFVLPALAPRHDVVAPAPPAPVAVAAPAVPVVVPVAPTPSAAPAVVPATAPHVAAVAHEVSAEAKAKADAARRAKLSARARKFLAAPCADQSQLLLVGNVLKKMESSPTFDLGLFERKLEQAELSCPQH